MPKTYNYFYFIWKLKILFCVWWKIAAGKAAISIVVDATASSSTQNALNHQEIFFQHSFFGWIYSCMLAYLIACFLTKTIKVCDSNSTNASIQQFFFSLVEFLFFLEGDVGSVHCVHQYCAVFFRFLIHLKRYGGKIHFFAVNVSFNLYLIFNGFWTQCIKSIHLSRLQSSLAFCVLVCTQLVQLP